VSVPDTLRVDGKATAVLAVWPPVDGSVAQAACDEGAGDDGVEETADEPTGATGPMPETVKSIVDVCPFR
jgi:hypothetical protein